MKKQDNIKAAHYCFFINNKVKKITLMSTKTNKQIKKKEKKTMVKGIVLLSSK